MNQEYTRWLEEYPKVITVLETILPYFTGVTLSRPTIASQLADIEDDLDYQAQEDGEDLPTDDDVIHEWAVQNIGIQPN